MKAALIASMALAAATAGAGAPGAAPNLGPQNLDPKVLSYILPDQIPWTSGNIPGADTANLVGDPAKPGFYVVMNRFHPGTFTHPHYHPNERYIYVVAGTWWVGTGAKWDPAHGTVPFKAGSFVVHKARQVHYDGARAGGEGATVMIFGQGPGSRIPCDGKGAETGPGPCADAIAATGG
jgi:quercetin dioxygenase-like cupin family protein